MEKEGGEGKMESEVSSRSFLRGGRSREGGWGVLGELGGERKGTCRDRVEMMW